MWSVSTCYLRLVQLWTPYYEWSIFHHTDPGSGGSGSAFKWNQSTSLVKETGKADAWSLRHYVGTRISKGIRMFHNVNTGIYMLIFFPGVKVFRGFFSMVNQEVWHHFQRHTGLNCIPLKTLVFANCTVHYTRLFSATICFWFKTRVELKYIGKRAFSSTKLFVVMCHTGYSANEISKNFQTFLLGLYRILIWPDILP